MTSDLQLQAQMVEQRSFVQPGGLPNGLQDMNPLTSTQPEPGQMEASPMEAVQNQRDSQNQQTCKYDLLSSVPRESNLFCGDDGKRFGSKRSKPALNVSETGRSLGQTMKQNLPSFRFKYLNFIYKTLHTS